MNLSYLFFFIKNFKHFYFKNNNIKLNKYNHELNELQNKGFVIVKNYLSRENCKNIQEKLINTIEKHKDQIWKSESLDYRIWGFEKFENEVNEFLKDENLVNLFKKYENQSKLISSTTLGANIKFIKNGKGSGGGWHRDRTFYKYKYSKAMIYLNDVDEKNGAFQYLEKSHHLFNIIKINNHLKKISSDKWFDNREIEESSKKLNLKINTLSANAGDMILFDATGIHRGMPLKSGERFALTNYYRFDPNEELPFQTIND